MIVLFAKSGQIVKLTDEQHEAILEKKKVGAQEITTDGRIIDIRGCEVGVGVEECETILGNKLRYWRCLGYNNWHNPGSFCNCSRDYKPRTLLEKYDLHHVKKLTQSKKSRYKITKDKDGNPIAVRA